MKRITKTTVEEVSQVNEIGDTFLLHEKPGSMIRFDANMDRLYCFHVRRMENGDIQVYCGTNVRCVTDRFGL